MRLYCSQITLCRFSHGVADLIIRETLHANSAHFKKNQANDETLLPRTGSFKDRQAHRIENCIVNDCK